MSAAAWSSVDHYENFPVASLLIPAALRPAVIALYHFARAADDLADEGDLDETERLQRLDALAEAVRNAHRSPLGGIPGEPLQDGGALELNTITALQPHILAHKLPVSELLNLLSAFRQDVETRRYRDRAAVTDYCRRSANPVGRLMLRVFEADDAVSIEYSDRICSALQLINFLQDVAIDWRKGRVYIPQQTLAAAGSSDRDIEAAVESGSASPALLNALASEARYASSLLASGRPLLGRVPWRLGLELRAILAGGHRILEHIERQGGNVFKRRPKLGWRDAPALLRLTLSSSR